jgi:hypothetical protein
VQYSCQVGADVSANVRQTCQLHISAVLAGTVLAQIHAGIIDCGRTENQPESSSGVTGFAGYGFRVRVHFLPGKAGSPLIVPS